MIKIIIVLLALLSANTHAETKAEINETDPYESFNRSMHEFNLVFIDKVGKPVADAYLNNVPQPARIGIKNFVYNLKMPMNILNAFLQGKAQKGFEGIMRFSINSVFGLAGILDIATPAGLPYEKKDFAQTLFIWGAWQETNYVVLPILGPYTTREIFGSGASSIFDPTYRIIPASPEFPILATGTYLFSNFTETVDFVDTMKSQPDSYIFLRESYIQHRKNTLYDGNAPQPKLDDFNFE